MTVSSTYLLRVRLPDQPGVLGKVATALGSTGADIESIVIVDRAPGFAVDDLVVTLPPGALADKLVSAASSVHGVVVETVQRHHSRHRMQDELALLDDAVSSADPLAVLAAGLPELFHASYALVVERDGGGDAVALAASISAPDQSCRADWLPLDAPREISAAQVWTDPDVAGPDCELVAVPFRQTAALLIARIGGPAFRPAELTRLSHLARVAHALLAGP